MAPTVGAVGVPKVAEVAGGVTLFQRTAPWIIPRFDRVVIDSTSAHFADAGVLEPLVDGVLLIVRAGRTSRPSVARALGHVPRAKLLGLVLNDSRASSR